MKNQAGPAQDPWPPKPSRSGPGPLAPQAKPVRPRTLGPIQWSQMCLWAMVRGNTIGNTIGNSIGNTIGNSIGNSIKKNPDFPDTPFEDISIF